MTPAATLREFEQRFLSQRTIAAEKESWEAYANDMLPGGHYAHPLIQQGFEAGFDAAINRVRVLLFTMQAEANESAQVWHAPDGHNGGKGAWEDA